MLLVYTPVPVPSLVLLFEMVGLAVILQQTPLAVTEEPPSEVTLPPPVAVVCAMLVMDVVVTVGRDGDKVVKVTWLP
jgi:hypothetical protein